MFPVDAFRKTLGKAVDIFQRLSIRFHLTGGITTIAYGEPRMTQDLDLVIENRAVAAQLDPFLASLEASDFLFDLNAVRKAVAEEGMFQLLDGVESLKLDIYPRELIPGELDRSELMEVFEGVKLPVACRADAAASKLVWISKGSQKSRRDLRQIWRTSSETDQLRVRDLANQLGLDALLEEVLAEPDEMVD